MERPPHTLRSSDPPETRRCRGAVSPCNPHILALAALLLLAATPSPAAASPEQPLWATRSTVLIDSHAFRNPDGDTVLRRRFTNQLSLASIPRDASPIDGLVVCAFTLDAGLPGNVDDPLLAERQLEPTLHVARIRYTPLPHIETQLGRHLLPSPLGLALIDGASATLHPPSGPRLALHAGVRPEAARWQIDDWSHAPDGDPELRSALRESAAVLEARTGWDERFFGIAAGGRIEPALSGQTRYADSLLGAARVGPQDGPHGHASVRYSPTLHLVDRAELRLDTPLGQRAGLHASSLLTRPVFPLDSLFSVFPLHARAEVGLGGHLHLPTGTRADLTLLTTAWSEEETATPSPFGPDAELGLDLGADHRFSDARLRLGGRARLVGNTEQHRTTLLSRAAWRTGARGPDLQLILSALSWKDPLRPRDPTGTAARTTLGATFHTAGLTSISSLLSLGLDHRGDLSARAIAIADIRLPGDIR